MTAHVTDVGDSCVTLELEPAIDPLVNDVCLFIAERIAKAGIHGIRDIVTTYHTVAVHVEPPGVNRDAIAHELTRLASAQPTDALTTSAQHEIAVCYGEEFGPDLDGVARFAGCTPDEVIRIHSQRMYRVYMIGFLPGFPYLGIVDTRIAMPRHETPRPRVSAGSVAIAGTQTGIYPIDSPGGWRVIGRTWLKPFDVQRADPSLFHAGDSVRFVPVSRRSYFDAIGERSDAVP